MGPKPVGEVESRQNFYKVAQQLGCHKQFSAILERYDPLIAKATSPANAKHFRIMALVEIWRLFEFRDALVVDGVEILPAQPQLVK